MRDESAMVAELKLERMVNSGFTLVEIRDYVMRWAIVKALRLERGHQIKAAKRLGVHRNTLTRLKHSLGVKTILNGKNKESQ